MVSARRNGYYSGQRSDRNRRRPMSCCTVPNLAIAIVAPRPYRSVRLSGHTMVGPTSRGHHIAQRTDLRRKPLIHRAPDS